MLSETYLWLSFNVGWPYIMSPDSLPFIIVIPNSVTQKHCFVVSRPCPFVLKQFAYFPDTLY